MGTVIQFIDHPKFEVDFARFKKGPDVFNPVDVSLGDVPAIVFQAMKESFSLVRSSVGTSFKYVVLGRHDEYCWQIPDSVCLVVFKFFVWIGGLAVCFVVTTFRLAWNQIYKFVFFAPKGMDISHLKTEELRIDVSQVPAEVTLDQLLTFFDEMPERMKGEVVRQDIKKESVFGNTACLRYAAFDGVLSADRRRSAVLDP
jgi:hypothetical protein